ncbi:hypothetical protein BJV78DRAFT_91441 [Lactifluus subvellereus]|nr:hypothetical protein BJV78DRAFT_91441 [Lactifluus subvellereus]
MVKNPVPQLLYSSMTGDTIYDTTSSWSRGLDYHGMPSRWCWWYSSISPSKRGLLGDSMLLFPLRFQKPECLYSTSRIYMHEPQLVTLSHKITVVPPVFAPVRAACEVTGPCIASTNAFLVGGLRRGRDSVQLPSQRPSLGLLTPYTIPREQACQPFCK